MLIFRKGFLDTGVERIVDQVVNPKLNTNFVPKIEDVSYKYLGIEKPVNRNRGLDLTPIDQNTFLPNLDLEQVSPESEQSPSICSKSPKSIDMALNEYQMDEINDKGDDLESPAFEPIEKAIKDELANAEDDDKMDISSDEEVEQNEPNINGTNLTCNTDDVKSNLSSISGLTSNDSINGSSCGDIEEKIDATTTAPIEPENIENTNPKVEEIVTENEIEQTAAIEAIKSESSETPKANDSTEIENINQDSVLSQVSSNSRLSIITNNNTNTRMDDADDGDTNNMENVNINSDDNAVKHDICPYGISEEAQMQKFNESSSSNNSLVIDMDNASNENSQCDKKDEFVTVFDINKEEIKFEGTERKSFDIDVSVIDSKSMEDVKLENQSNGLLTELKQEEFPPINECVETVNNTIEMSKEMKIKRENINSVSSDNNVNNVLKTTSPKLESTSNDVKLEASGTEDSKNVDDSNSSNKSKLKDKNDSKSSSSHRNGNESDNKSKSKNRNSSSSSSKDRHRGHSDRDKDKKYHSSSSRHSSSRDKNRSLVCAGALNISTTFTVYLFNCLSHFRKMNLNQKVKALANIVKVVQAPQSIDKMTVAKIIIKVQARNPLMYQNHLLRHLNVIKIIQKKEIDLELNDTRVAVAARKKNIIVIRRLQAANEILQSLNPNIQINHDHVPNRRNQLPKKMIISRTRINQL